MIYDRALDHLPIRRGRLQVLRVATNYGNYGIDSAAQSARSGIDLCVSRDTECDADVRPMVNK